MKSLILGYLFLLCFVTNPGVAQEIELVVTIDRQQAPDLPKNATDDLKSSLENFVNNKRWTEDNFSPQERIKCNMLLTLTTGSILGRYISIAQIQFVRPIYGTTYESILLTFLDKNFDFEFALGQPLDYNENIYISNIVSMMSYYSYIALALDYDSFSKLGGSPYIEKAFNLANIAQQAGPPALNVKNGWELGEFNNRMALIVNLNNQLFIPFREGLYIYHRKAMDTFKDNPEDARQTIIVVLKSLKTIRQQVAISVVSSSFFLAKKQELIQVFSKANQETKTEVLNLLREIDALNSEAYNAIMKN